MCDHAALTVHRQLQHDPTRTTTLRQRFEGEASRRFRNVAGIIREAVVDLDVLGLRDPKTPTVNRDAPGVGARAFDFESTPQKISGFMQWLRRMEDEQVLDIMPGQTVEQAAARGWSNIYIRNAYQKGIAHAGQQMRRAGAEVAPRWIDAAFARPIHADRAGILYTRTFKALQGITDEMDKQISRILADGMIEGVNPLEMARRMTDRVDKIGRTRARVLARSEVINAHAESSLNAYAEAGLEGVSARAELATAGDGRVCERCQALEGKVYTIAEARGLIPVHPGCRCAWLPALDDMRGVTLQ